VLARFRSLDERLRRSGADVTGLALTTNEGFVLSRIGGQPMTIQDLISVSAMEERDALHTAYTLWLGGLIVRDDYQPAFSPAAVAAMRGARLALKQEARLLTVKDPIAQPPSQQSAPVEQLKEVEITLDLDEYLSRVESAETYYDVLGIDPKADIPEIKRAYFSLAKAFHPDKFHSEGREMARRVQNAFQTMMQAHETLKSNDTRDLYDYRMRSELAARSKRDSQGGTGQAHLQTEQASEQFDRGFTLLVDGDAEAAIPLLARAAHYAPKVARYHAYYGKALAADPKQRHKAEAEMQAAIKLDPDNATFRILLAEFFIHFNLFKRAEGELTRLLSIFPSNREAQELLASLKAKA
jgi:tetratricopeptide (TPR) repeat protein